MRCYSYLLDFCDIGTDGGVGGGGGVTERIGDSGLGICLSFYRYFATF